MPKCPEPHPGRESGKSTAGRRGERSDAETVAISDNNPPLQRRGFVRKEWRISKGDSCLESLVQREFPSGKHVEGNPSRPLAWFFAAVARRYSEGATPRDAAITLHLLAPLDRGHLDSHRPW